MVSDWSRRLKAGTCAAFQNEKEEVHLPRGEINACRDALIARTKGAPEERNIQGGVQFRHSFEVILQSKEGDRESLQRLATFPRIRSVAKRDDSFFYFSPDRFQV